MRISPSHRIVPLTLALAIASCATRMQASESSGTGAVQASLPAASIAPLASPVAAPMGDIAELVDRVKPGVVNIVVTKETAVAQADMFDFFFGPRGQGRGPEQKFKQSGVGSGFVVDSDGYVVTNAHVVADATEVKVRFFDERELAAKVVGRDEKMDLALLKVEGGGQLPSVPLGSSEKLRVGEAVVAVGNPFGLGHTVTAGIVSAKSRSIGAGPYDHFIQTDASINPGNSGGPLFNLRGEVVGINTAIRPGANNIGFAIPSDDLKDIWSQLKDKGFVERGKIGVLIQPLSEELARGLHLPSTTGALVAEVEAGGPASKAGLVPGDVIVEVSGVPIKHSEELPRVVAKNPPGSRVSLTYIRNGKPREASLTLAKLDGGERGSTGPESSPSEGTAGNLGLTLSDAGGKGARVVALNGPGELEVGDVIVEVAGKAVSNAKDASRELGKLRPGQSAAVRVVRRGGTFFAAVTMPVTMPMTPPAAPSR